MTVNADTKQNDNYADTRITRCKITRFSRIIVSRIFRKNEFFISALCSLLFFFFFFFSLPSRFTVHAGEAFPKKGPSSCELGYSTNGSATRVKNRFANRRASSGGWKAEGFHFFFFFFNNYSSCSNVPRFRKRLIKALPPPPPVLPLEHRARVLVTRAFQ